MGKEKDSVVTNTHGGRRANAGRKPSPYPLKVRNIKVPEHWQWNKGIRAKIRELMQSEAGMENLFKS